MGVKGLSLSLKFSGSQFSYQDHWKDFVQFSFLGRFPFLSELVGQFKHFANGMRQFEWQFICHFFIYFKMAHTTLTVFHSEEFKESVLQIATLHLQTDQFGWLLVLTKGKSLNVLWEFENHELILINVEI